MLSLGCQPRWTAVFTSEHRHIVLLSALTLSKVASDGGGCRDQVVRFLGTGIEGLLPSHHQFNEVRRDACFVSAQNAQRSLCCMGAQGDMVAISQNGPLDENEDSVEGVVLERAKR